MSSVTIIPRRVLAKTRRVNTENKVCVHQYYMDVIYISKRYWWWCVDELTFVDLVEGSVVEVAGDDVSAPDSHAEQIVHPVQ